MATQEKHRKIIDLSASVFRILSVRASMENTNLKNYIEKMLEDEALTSDENLYEFLQENYPTQVAEPDEQDEFRSWLER